MAETNSQQTYARHSEVQQISQILEQGAKPVEDPKPRPDPNADQDDNAGDNSPEHDQEARSSEPGNDSPDNSSNQDPAEDPQGEGQDDQSPQQLADDDDPVTLNDLAEQLDLEARDLYDLEIKVGKDERATLGELKDSFKDYKQMKADQGSFEERKLKQDNEVMVAKRQIEQLVEVGIKTNSLHPEVLAKLEQVHADNVQRERRAVLEVLPEWSDTSVRSEAYENMTRLMTRYGFSRSEVEGVLDHRLLKFMVDMTTRENQIDNARVSDQGGKVPANQGKGRKRVLTKSKLKDRISAAKQPGATRQEKHAAISELINQR